MNRFEIPVKNFGNLGESGSRKNDFVIFKNKNGLQVGCVFEDTSTVQEYLTIEQVFSPN